MFHGCKVMGAAVVVAGLVGSLAGQADAVVMMQTHSDSASGTNFGTFSGNNSGSVDLTLDFTLPQFDPSLGTLLVVDVEFIASSEIIFDDLHNNSDTDITYTENFSSSGFVSAPGVSDGQSSGSGSGGNPLAIATSVGGKLSDPAGDIPVGTYSVSPGDLPLYVGLGTIAAQMTGSSSYSVSNIDPALAASRIFWDGAATVRGTVNVTYTFDDGLVADGAVPEPISAGLSVMSLAAIGYATKRRRMA